MNKFDLSADGIDRHFAVNHLGHFLLVNQLLPLMRRTTTLPNSSPARIITVSSELHRTASPTTRFTSLEELNDPGPAKGSLGEANGLYARSKLANILFSKGLVERVLIPNKEQGRVYVLTTHPGAAHTGQQDQSKEAYGKVFGGVMKVAVIPFMRSPDQGSLSTLWAAVADDVTDGQKWQGKYLTDPGEDGKESTAARDGELEENLWGLSEKLVNEKLGREGLLPWSEGAGRL